MRVVGSPRQAQLLLRPPSDTLEQHLDGHCPAVLLAGGVSVARQRGRGARSSSIALKNNPSISR